MENEIISLKLTVKHVNLILAHLSKGVYAEVIEAINLIAAQGNPQMAELQKPKPTQTAQPVADEAAPITTEAPAAPEAVN